MYDFCTCDFSLTSLFDLVNKLVIVVKFLSDKFPHRAAEVIKCSQVLWLVKMDACSVSVCSLKLFCFALPSGFAKNS